VNLKDETQQVLACVAHWEGRISWPYLDNAEHPNVTIGIGCLISTVDDLRALPLRRYQDDCLTTPEESGAEFCRLRSMRGGQRAAAYRGAYYLAGDAIDDLACHKLAAARDALPSVFPTFTHLPPPAQTCLLDLAWNVGVAGLRPWKHLRGALSANPVIWDVVEANCQTANPLGLPQRAARNAWRAQCIRAAARGDVGIPTPL
jgi:hypothetical protein